MATFVKGRRFRKVPATSYLTVKGVQVREPRGTESTDLLGNWAGESGVSTAPALSIAKAKYPMTSQFCSQVCKLWNIRFGCRLHLLADVDGSSRRMSILSECERRI